MTKNYALSFLAAGMLLFGSAQAQLAFKNMNSKLANANFHSGCPVTIVDMNGDGLDDIVRLNQGNDAYIEYQQVNGNFVSQHIGTFGAGNNAWAMCVADVDHNGYKDILADGPSSIILMRVNASGLMSTFTLPTSGFFLQNATFADINNDGWIDIFACDDNAASHVYINNGAGSFAISTIINFDVTTTDDSGNYGSVWTDFDNDGDCDLYIAKCRQGVTNPADGRRINVMFVNNGNGTFTEAAATYSIAVGAQSWTASFGDIDNDADFDLLLTNHDVPTMILENDGTGHYSDITSTTNVSLTGTPIESVFEDFDNDGFVDILITGSYHEYFRNNGNKTFTKVTSTLFDANDMESFAIGDVNHDGKIDVYASYANIYTTPTTINDVIWFNDAKNSNNFVTLNLEGTISNQGAIGARAYIYGAWGVQTREVRAGESYGTVNSAALHFGLGTAASIDSITINWPSGVHTVIPNPQPNQFITVIENTCVSPANVITYSGQPVLCSGQSLQLNAASGPYNYNWSNGANTQNISVNTTGDYAVTLSQAGNQCVSTSPIVTVINSPNETPAISAMGDTTFCYGGNVTLTSSSATTYTWSTGANTQSINVTQSGTYNVVIQGACQTWSSNTIQVDVLGSTAPNSNNVSIPTPGTATLTATGTGGTLNWYTVPSGGASVGSGSPFVTPFLNNNTSYYVEEVTSYGGQFVNGGMIYHRGTAYSGSTGTNAYTIFTVNQTCTLDSVKIYSDTPGARIIELRSSTGTVLQSYTVNVVPDTMWVPLNFNMTPGNYQLGTNTAANTTLLGYASPRLRRSSSNTAYPYNINGLVNITNSSQGTTVYYYFYDWKVSVPPMVCVGPRTQVDVTILSTGIGSINGVNFNLYPNPNNGTLNLAFGKEMSNGVNVEVHDLSGRLIKTISMDRASANETYNIDLNDLSSGSYFVRIVSEGQTATTKIIISK